jgi:hypothetical protein
MRTFRLIAFSSLLAAFASSAIDAGSLRIALLASAEVQNDTILLANLFPPNISRRLRAAAENIALGATPQEGGAREFTRASLTSAISSAGLSPADFAIPQNVIVRRGGRLITRREIGRALQFALANNPGQGISSSQLQDITLDAAVRVPAGDPGLEVTQIVFDRSIDRVRFRLWPRRAPGVLPFFVTAKIAAPLSAPSTLRHLVTVAAHSPVPAPVDRPVLGPVLVAAGRLAQLHIRSSDLDMLLEVRALQRGRLGEVIRVQLPGTGRTFQARVTGEEYLDATL